MPDITTTQIFSDGEKGITATKMNNIIANSVIQPDFVTAKPSSSTLDPTDQLLEVKGAGTYARITGSQLISSVSAQVDATPQIYSVRLRSFNAIGNPTFEVDQRMTGGTLATNGFTWTQDRWQAYNNTGVAPYWAIGSGQAIKLPGTNFRISSGISNFSTQSVSKASLAAVDQLLITEYIEGPQMRELIDDVHSVSILANTNVTGGLKFALALRDSGATRSLVKLCTLPTPNTWTLLQFPNIPIWSSGGGWSISQGQVGYTLNICLAAGATMITPANDTWQTGNFVGAIGMDNILSKPSNSNLQIAFIQHEPGAQCTTPIDCQFGQNLDGSMGCLRYFCKSYDYGVLAGTVAQAGQASFTSANSHGTVWGPLRFPKLMARTPTVNLYNPTTGAVNSARDPIGGNYSTSSPIIGLGGLSAFNISPSLGSTAGGMAVWFHFSADTIW